MTEPVFKRGDRVRMGAVPTMQGVIVDEPVLYGLGYSYEVFFGGSDIRRVTEANLETVPDRGMRVVDRDGFLRSLIVTKLRNPLADLFYAFQASRTEFEPYQFKPVLKFLESPTPRILIADEVGLGKTIEAAILLQELRARTNINRVLVVCPAGLREKWQMELLTRFDESFTVLNKQAVLSDIRGYEETNGAQPLTGIVGLETMRARDVQRRIDESSVRFDLVIVDEAHHLRTAGRLSNQLGGRLSELTDNLVLLTATPLQTGPSDLYNLLRFLDESQFQSAGDFLDQLQPNALLNAAIRCLRVDPPDVTGAREALQRMHFLPAGDQVMAHPLFRPTIDRLRVSMTDRAEVVGIQRDIDRMNVLASVYTRTRKRDVTRVAKRVAVSLTVPLTAQEREFYDAVLAHARAQARLRSTSGNVPGFAGMMRERQAASCMTAARRYLVDLARNEAAELGFEESSSDVAPENGSSSRHRERLLAIANLIRSAEKLGDIDSKFDVFLIALNEALAGRATAKVIVFSFFRRCVFRRKRSVSPEFSITPGSEAAERPTRGLGSPPDDHLLSVCCG